MTDGYSINRREDFSEYSGLICERLKQGEDISAELRDAFLKSFVEVMTRNIMLPENFRKLAALAASQSESDKESFVISPSQTKDMIYILSFLMYLRQEAEHARRRDEELKSKSNSRLRRILGIIQEEGRIRHKELAERLGVTPSALTQFLSRYENDDIFTAYKPGREKIYLLTDRGQAILKEFARDVNAAGNSYASEDRGQVTPDPSDKKEAGSKTRSELITVKKELEKAKKCAADLRKENRALKKKLTKTRKRQRQAAYNRWNYELDPRKMAGMLITASPEERQNQDNLYQKDAEDRLNVIISQLDCFYKQKERPDIFLETIDEKAKRIPENTENIICEERMAVCS